MVQISAVHLAYTLCLLFTCPTLQAKVTDRTQVMFYTNATAYDPIPTGGYNGTGNGAAADPSSNASCNKLCVKFWDIACFIR